MIIIGIHLTILTIALISLGILVWHARPHDDINRWFAASVTACAMWALGIALAYLGVDVRPAFRLAFAAGSLIPPCFLVFAYAYPAKTIPLPQIILRGCIATGIVFAVLSLFTELVAYDHAFVGESLSRRPGALYPVFAGFSLLTLSSALVLLLRKWRSAAGLRRVQLQYLGVGALLSIVPAITTNVLLPLLTGRSTFSWLGPYFMMPFVLIVAHAIIRHRLMDLRVVVRRGLTIAIATTLSLAPVAVMLLLFWPALLQQLTLDELIKVCVALIVTSLLVPPTRDIAGVLLDRYVYRTQTNYRSTIRHTSRVFTALLKLPDLLRFVVATVSDSTESEGAGVYLYGEQGGLALTSFAKRHESAAILLPEHFPSLVGQVLFSRLDCVVADELPRDGDEAVRQLHNELTRLNWALVLPLLSEDSVIGAIVVGPKLSGDPFYPHDIDLLMTLANQAGIAVKNAQLYTEVVLANEYVENIVATIESGVVAVNAGGRVTRFNRAAAQLTGLVGEDLVGRPVEALPAALATLLRTTLADGQARTQPEVALPDGTTTRPVICTTSSLRDPSRGVLGAVAVFSDLTPLKQLEAERRRVERLAYFEILASSIAHEIKNPLVAIKAFAQLVPRRHQDPQFIDEFSRVVTREIGRMERLVERLRTLAHPSDRPKQPLDLRGPAQDAVEFLRPVFEEKDITLAVSLGQEPRPVVGDAGELESLFLNLLMNAHEATPPGGAVTLDLAATAERFVVTVADSGPGIPPDLVEHVFDPFITTKPRGSGLGLSICSGIAAAHRAKLLAANRPAGGAVFTIEFQIAVPIEGTLEHEDRSARHRR